MPVTLYPNRGGLRVPQGAGAYPGSIGKQYRAPGVPADALGNLGDRYFDATAQRWYLKRWVGRLSGTDYVSVLVDMVSMYFDCSFSFLYNNMASTRYAKIAGGMRDGSNSAFVATPNPDGKIGVSTDAFGRDYAGTIALDQAWKRYSLTYKMATNTVLVSDGTSSQSIAVAPPSNPATRFQIGTVFSGQSPNGNICEVRAQGNGKSLIWRIDEGSGATILDSSGNALHGTVTDGTPNDFWFQTWVPMDLL